MLGQSIPSLTSRTWQEQLSYQMTQPEEFLDFVQLDEHWLPAAKRAAELFPLRVSHAYASRIEKGNPQDPLLLQVLPLQRELQSSPGFTTDPLDERNFNPVPGLIHKYHGRILLIAAPHCAINCRYCFRRHFDYSHNTPSRQEWQVALDYIAQRKEVDEVILSGGDPLVLGDKQLAWLLDALAKLPQIERVRIHTRLPIVLPDRITPKILEIFSRQQTDIVFVIHCNHRQEIDTRVTRALADLRSAGVTLLNQTVLLKSINDNANILISLSKELFRCGVLPYYLHLLDRVSGTSHFNVSEHHARQLRDELLAQLPGYLVPKLVKEEPGASSKSPIA